MKTPPHPFITHLESLAEDRGALAGLRRGLGQPPGTVPDMFRYVVPRLPDNASKWTEQTYYLIASLFALHPVSTESGNLGDHFAKLRDPDTDKNTSLERRFTALLTAHPEDLHIYLRQAISFLKSQDETPVNWHQRMFDVLQLSYAESAAKVQKRWAKGFWAYQQKEELTNEPTS